MRGASKLKPTPPGEDLLGAIGNPDVLCSAIAGEAVGLPLVLDWPTSRRTTKPGNVFWGCRHRGREGDADWCLRGRRGRREAPTDTRGAALVAAANACFACKEATAAPRGGRRRRRDLQASEEQVRS